MLRVYFTTIIITILFACNSFADDYSYSDSILRHPIKNRNVFPQYNIPNNDLSASSIMEKNRNVFFQQYNNQNNDLSASGIMLRSIFYGALGGACVGLAVYWGIELSSEDPTLGEEEHKHTSSVVYISAGAAIGAVFGIIMGIRDINKYNK